jgi:hypothetical protein
VTCVNNFETNLLDKKYKFKGLPKTGYVYYGRKIAAKMLLRTLAGAGMLWRKMVVKSY